MVMQGRIGDEMVRSIIGEDVEAEELEFWNTLLLEQQEELSENLEAMEQEIDVVMGDMERQIERLERQIALGIF